VTFAIARPAHFILAIVCVGCSSSTPPVADQSPDSAAVDTSSLRFQDRRYERLPDAPAPDITQLPDKSPPDKSPPDKPPVDPCPTSWSSWSCGPSPVPGGCIAKCGGYVLTCVPGLPLAPQACACVKGTLKKTCTGKGLLCNACDDAMPSCCGL
jgi:hypothetical protein